VLFLTLKLNLEKKTSSDSGIRCRLADYKYSRQNTTQLTKRKTQRTNRSTQKTYILIEVKAKEKRSIIKKRHTAKKKHVHSHTKCNPKTRAKSNTLSQTRNDLI